MALWRSYCCHENAIIRFPFIDVGVDVAVRYMKVLSLTLQMHCVSVYTIFRPVLNNNYLILPRFINSCIRHRAL
jgi:hypothetical protein